MGARHPPHDLHQLFSQYIDCVLLVNLNDEILYANPAALRLLCRITDRHGYLPPILRTLNDQEALVKLRDLADTELYLEIKSHCISWQERHVKLINICDRTQSMQRLRELEQLVYRDELTGLFNRRGMELEVRQLLSRANSLQRKLNVLFIDVNGLKQINDNLGHTTGDAALLETAAAIREGFGEQAIAARIGGDEFGVFLLEDAELPLQRCVETIQNRLDRINQHKVRSYRLSLSIGMSQYTPGQVFDFKQLIKQADQNMYRAKTIIDPVPSMPNHSQASTVPITSNNVINSMKPSGTYS